MGQNGRVADAMAATVPAMMQSNDPDSGSGTQKVRGLTPVERTLTPLQAADGGQRGGREGVTVGVSNDPSVF